MKTKPRATSPGFLLARLSLLFRLNIRVASGTARWRNDRRSAGIGCRRLDAGIDIRQANHAIAAVESTVQRLRGGTVRRIRTGLLIRTLRLRESGRSRRRRDEHHGEKYFCNHVHQWTTVDERRGSPKQPSPIDQARSIMPASPPSVPQARRRPSPLQASAVTGASPGLFAKISAPSSIRIKSTMPSA